MQNVRFVRYAVFRDFLANECELHCDGKIHATFFTADGVEEDAHAVVTGPCNGSCRPAARQENLTEILLRLGGQPPRRREPDDYEKVARHGKEPLIGTWFWRTQGQEDVSLHACTGTQHVYLHCLGTRGQWVNVKSCDGSCAPRVTHLHEDLRYLHGWVLPA